MTNEELTTRAAFLRLVEMIPDGEMQVTRELIEQILPAEDSPNALDIPHTVAMLVRSVALLDRVVSKISGGYEISELS